MARVATTYDPFNALAEPKRRLLMEALGSEELPVSQIVERLGWPQPMVSKHLAVLKDVGLVRERKVGRQRLYRVDASQLKPIYDWVKTFERQWEARLDRLEEYLRELQEENDDRNKP
jgi:DNA-binding transcriptional ArsR family regulator